MKKLLFAFGLAMLLVLVLFPSALAVDPSACSHPSFKWVVKSEPTCSITGTEWYTCTVCNKALYFRNTAINPNNHRNFKLIPEIKATCSKPGRDRVICSDCGTPIKTQSSSKNPNNHPSSALKWVPVKKATCTSKGKDNHVCNACGRTIGTRTSKIDPDNHPSSKLSGWKPKVEADCMHGGTEIRMCSACNKEAASRTTGKDKNNHKYWGDPIIIEQCIHRNGSITQYCRCGEKNEENIPKDPPESYEPDWEPYSEQTCTTAEVFTAKCPVCGMPSSKTTKPALDHHKCNSNNNTWPYPNKCEDAEYYEWCDRPGCPLNEKRRVVIPGEGHIPDEQEIDGKWVMVCSRCGNLLPDDYRRYPGF